MNIVKGDTVYLRSGKDVSAGDSRLEAALHKSGAELQEIIANMPMTEQIAKANEVKGKRGKVLRVLPKEGKVVVDGLNIVTKHQRPKGQGAAQVQQGGRIHMPAPIPASRVMLVCPACEKPTRVVLKTVEEERQTLNGTKTVIRRERYCKHKDCGQIIPRPTKTNY